MCFQHCKHDDGGGASAHCWVSICCAQTASSLHILPTQSFLKKVKGSWIRRKQETSLSQKKSLVAAAETASECCIIPAWKRGRLHHEFTAHTDEASFNTQRVVRQRLIGEDSCLITTSKKQTQPGKSKCCKCAVKHQIAGMEDCNMKHKVATAGNSQADDAMLEKM